MLARTCRTEQRAGCRPSRLVMRRQVGKKIQLICVASVSLNGGRQSSSAANPSPCMAIQRLLKTSTREGPPTIPPFLPPSLSPSLRLSLFVMDALRTNEQKGLVPTLTELLQDVQNEAFVLRSARTLIARVSGREANGTGNSIIGNAFGVAEDDQMMTMMNVA